MLPIVVTPHYLQGVLSLNCQGTEGDQTSYPRANDKRAGECRIQFIVCIETALNENSNYSYLRMPQAVDNSGQGIHR